jgi:hypothetical protein
MLTAAIWPIGMASVPMPLAPSIPLSTSAMCMVGDVHTHRMTQSDWGNGASYQFKGASWRR